MTFRKKSLLTEFLLKFSPVLYVLGDKMEGVAN